MERMIWAYNTDDNYLTHVSEDDFDGLDRLEVLRINNNQLSTLNVSKLRALKTLYLDKNKLEQVEGLQSLKQLDSISVREQRLNGVTK
jgi:Leucine-rich repeat (LRR) protein